MTARIEKTVFISYRRTNLPWALAIYQELTHHGYDVFFDYLSIPSGDFENIIVENIKGRAHFVVILTPSALERCNESGDWLRREIETAMDEKRNIVPLMLESFDFGSPSIVNLLTGKLEKLKKYNGLRLHSEYFFEGMNRLREQFLNVALDAIIHPISVEAQPVIGEHQTAASEAKPVEKDALSAQEWIERGNIFADASNYDEAIRCYTKAIQLNPPDALAYYNRGTVFARYQNNNDDAFNDFCEAIQINPDYADAYLNRGNTRQSKGDLDGAIADYSEAIRVEPKNAMSYNNRGNARADKGDMDGAFKDFEEAIRLKTDYDYAYNNRGKAHHKTGNLNSAIKDFNQALRINPNFIEPYGNRGAVYYDKGNYRAALKDYETYIKMNGGNKREVEEFLPRVKEKLRQKSKSKNLRTSNQRTRRK